MAYPAKPLRQRARSRKGRTARPFVGAPRRRWRGSLSLPPRLQYLFRWALHWLPLTVPRRVALASSQARAALDGLPSVPAMPAARPTLRLPDRARLSAIPHRLAAHLLMLLIVVVIVAANGLMYTGVGDPQPPLAVARPAAGDAPDDVQAVSMLRAFSVAVEQPLALQRPLSDRFVASAAFIQTHQLGEGETLQDVANRYGIDVPSLFWSNDLQNLAVLAVGQELRIPRLAGMPHVVQEGETLEAIAQSLQVPPAAISQFAGNALAAGLPLAPGRELFVPGGRRAYPQEVLDRFGGEQQIASLRAVYAGLVREQETSLREGPSRAHRRISKLPAGLPVVLLARHADWLKVDAGAAGAGWIRSDLLQFADGSAEHLPETNDFPPPPPVWVWPANGRMTSGFGYRSAPFRSFHDGLDIANGAGTRIVAARSGRVIEAGWCRGFGYCVKIDHGDGMVTIYGHLLRQPVVSAGDTVEAGDTIGAMGSTYDAAGGGYSTGVHLHFTVKVNGQAVDPLKFLP